jgi:hypothetical protein
MRYHWGLGVGHVYSHGQRVDIPTPAPTFHATPDTASAEVILDCSDNQYGETDAENPEFGFENREDDWIDVGEDLGEERYDDDDDMLVAMDDMYGSAEQVF